jgi:hypothetical protein
MQHLQLGVYLGPASRRTSKREEAEHGKVKQIVVWREASNLCMQFSAKSICI